MRQEEVRGHKIRQADMTAEEMREARSNKLSKSIFQSTQPAATLLGTNWLLVHFMHGSTLVYTMLLYWVYGASGAFGLFGSAHA